MKKTSHKKNWKKFEKNNKTIALNILYVSDNTGKIRHAYESKMSHMIQVKNDEKHQNQVILLMITDGKKWHYLAVKSCLHYIEG